MRQDERTRLLGPPRFTLRALWVAITLMGCLFALMTALGAMWSLVILLFSGLLVAHVAGNSLGTKLRDRATHRMIFEQTVSPAPRHHACPKLAPPQLAECARLNRITLVVTAGAAAAGGMLGGIGSAGLYPEAGAAAVALGVASFAVLGAFGGFAISSFVSVFRGAMREALGKTVPHAHQFSPPRPR